MGALLGLRLVPAVTAIAGFWSLRGEPAAAVACERMLSAQAAYGPHRASQWSDGRIAVGARLFRSLPEDAYDRQPLCNAASRDVLVADVRLDNREELASALGVAPGTAARLCDASILLASLIRWGESSVDRIVGDFAFAWWNGNLETLVLARDYAGGRPLHYHRGQSLFAFATMPSGLHALPEIPLAADEQAMANFLALQPPERGRSFFKDVASVPPGHVVTLSRTVLSVRSYWNPPRPRGSGRLEDYVEGLRHHLDEATRSRLRGQSGTIVGSHLSGGYDSSAVTATAARLLAAEGGKVVSFTAVPRDGYDAPCPPGRIGDEGPLAAATAAMYENVEHILVRGSGASPVEDLDLNVDLFGRPILNLCNLLWANAINAAARERGLGVLLTGQIGNLSISYGGMELLPELLGSGRPWRWLREARSLVRTGETGWRRVVSHSVGPFLPASLWRGANRLLRRNVGLARVSAIHPKRLAEMARAIDRRSRPRKALEWRLAALLRDDHAMHNKAMLARWGVDQRDPTADRRLFEYCLAVPTETFLSGGRTRALARAALADRLPPAVLVERRKGYQAADWHEGFTGARGEMMTEVDRFAACDLAASLIDIARVRGTLFDWPTGGWHRQDVVASHRLALGRALAAGHFLRKCAGSPI